MMQTLIVKLLPDGSGRVCIHWFRVADDGPIKTPEGSVKTNLGPMVFGGVRGSIACMPHMNNTKPYLMNGQTHMVMRSEEVRAVTCPACMATEEFKKALADIELLVDTAHPVA